jgi:pre-mRNA-splicing factor CDC5/CEF1
LSCTIFLLILSFGLQGERRQDQEKKDRKKDSKKQARMLKANMPLAVMQINALNDPNQTIKRTKLALPAPQVSDQELEDIVKMGQQASSGGGGGSGATSALLGEYSSSAPTPTPLRTPSTPAGGDIVMQEAQNLVALTNASTPLSGGENPELQSGTGFGGVTPQTGRLTTPNVLAGDATPSSVRGTPMRTPSSVSGSTPMRDELSINQDGAYGMEASARMVRSRQKADRHELRSRLGNLPEPQNAYEISMPEAVQNDEEETALMDEDAEDRDRRNAAQRAADEEAEMRRRSQSVQRDLPRPVAVNTAAEVHANSEKEAAELLQEEVLRMLQWDASKHPMNTKTKTKPESEKELAKRLRRQARLQLESIPDQDLQQVRREMLCLCRSCC